MLPGLLTLSDQQKAYFLGVLRARFPDLVDLYHSLYPEESYGPVSNRSKEVGLRVREFCGQYGIRDRVPRPIIPGDRHTLNKRTVEVLAERIYAMELSGEPSYRVWSYRKAAWTIEDLEQGLGLVYQTLGSKGLQSIENVGPAMGRVIEQILNDLSR